LASVGAIITVWALPFNYVPFGFLAPSWKIFRRLHQALWSAPLRRIASVSPNSHATDAYESTARIGERWAHHAQNFRRDPESGVFAAAKASRYCQCWRKCANGESAEWHVAHNRAASLKRKPNRLTSTLEDWEPDQLRLGTRLAASDRTMGTRSEFGHV